MDNCERKTMSLEDKQKASLEALKHLRDYCEKNNITYYLAYGTLIGAVRHKGFIPWDDDVDVWVPRPDYERLLSEYKDESNQFRLFSCFSDKEYILPYAKLDNGHTARLNKDGSLDGRGIGIDLFPLDGLPQDLDYAARVFKRQNDKFFKIVIRLYSYSRLTADTAVHRIKHLVGKAGSLAGLINLTSRQVAKKMYSEEYEQCSMTACVTGIYTGRFIPFDKKWLTSTAMEFEGELFNCPGGYHEILSKIYGDYMSVPPETERTSTHTEEFVWR